MAARACLIAALALVPACDEVFDLEPVKPAGPGYRKTITIEQQTSSRFTGFPLSIALPADADLAAHASADTIGFVDAQGQPLACELVGFDADTGRLDAWVLLLELPPEPFQIDMLYGLSGTPCEKRNLWGGYRGVWHGELAVDRVRDSGLYKHDVVALSRDTVPSATAALVGNGLLFDGVDDVLCDPIDDDGSLAVAMTSFSYSVLINLSRDVGQYDSPFNKGGSSMSNPGFDYELGTSQWSANISDGIQPSPMQLGLLSPGRHDDWVHLVTVIDRETSTGRSYADGTLRDTKSLTGWGSFTTNEPLCFGFDGAALAGIVDEVRVYGMSVPSDWVAIEYTNLRHPEQMLTIGPETTR